MTPKYSMVVYPVMARYQFQALKPIMTITRAASRIQMKLMVEPFYL